MSHQQLPMIVLHNNNDLSERPLCKRQIDQQHSKLLSIHIHQLRFVECRLPHNLLQPMTLPSVCAQSFPVNQAPHVPGQSAPA